MRFVTPRVHLIAKTQLKEGNVREWLDSIGATEFSLQSDHLTTGAEKLVQLAGKRCYMSFQPGLNPNIRRVRTDIEDFITNILKVGHGSVLEHASFTFAIENVSRVFTGEMNRHRAGVAISEGSMRFIRYEDIPIVDVPSIKMMTMELTKSNSKIAATRKIISEITVEIEKAYSALREIWAEELDPDSKFASKKHITSMLRRIIPMGVATGGVWTLNLRALRHVFTMRCAESAEEEILMVASMMLKEMIESEPVFFKDFELVDGFWKPKYVKV